MKVALKVGRHTWKEGPGRRFEVKQKIFHILKKSEIRPARVAEESI